MKKFVLALAILATVAFAQDDEFDTEPKTKKPVKPAASSKCLYCRRMDLNAGFLVTYSYC